MQPSVYVINLDASPDRLAEMEKRLGSQNIKFQRIAGVLGKALSQQQLEQHYSPALNAKHYYKPLTASQIGCYLSHRKAWQAIAEGNAPWGIVLEDDIHLTGDLNLACQTIDKLNFDWTLIKLAAYQSRTRPIAYSHRLNAQFELVVHSKAMSGGAATAISKQGAKKLLANTEQFARPVDTDIQHFWEKEIEVLSLMPYPIAQDMAFESTIAAKKVKRQSHFLRRIRQTLYEKIANKRATTKLVQKMQKIFEE